MKEKFLVEKILPIQEWNEKSIEFDPDSSPKAWNIFRKNYTITHWPLISEFDLEEINLKKSGSITSIRLISYIKKKSLFSHSNKLWSKFKLAGDCDFNFNAKKCSLFKNHLINDDNIQLLNECHKKHHTSLNFSIMPVTGAMNNLKGNLYINSDGIKVSRGFNNDCYDRFDTFIYSLDLFYKKESNIILEYSRANKEPLQNFLDTFVDVYDYCNKIYFIENREFVDLLIKNGNKPIKTEEDVVNYMKLANNYWRLREEVLIS